MECLRPVEQGATHPGLVASGRWMLLWLELPRLHPLSGPAGKVGKNLWEGITAGGCGSRGGDSGPSAAGSFSFPENGNQEVAAWRRRSSVEAGKRGRPAGEERGSEQRGSTSLGCAGTLRRHCGLAHTLVRATAGKRKEGVEKLRTQPRHGEREG